MIDMSPEVVGLERPSLASYLPISEAAPILVTSRVDPPRSMPSLRMRVGHHARSHMRSP